MSLKDAKAAQHTLGFTTDGPPRPDADFYETPPEAVRSLLMVERFDGVIWEPACGAGKMAKPLVEAYGEAFAMRGRGVWPSDLYDYGYGFYGHNFLTDDFSHWPIKHIITNPPFSQAREFAERGREIVQGTGGKACFLNRLQWLEGIKRRPFLEEALSRVWVFSRRIPRMHKPKYDGKKSSSMIAFAWFVFDSQHKGETMLGWVDWKDWEGPSSMCTQTEGWGKNNG